MPINIDWLPVPDNNFDVGELFTKLFQKQNSAVWERRLGVYHPSSFGHCKRAMYYDRIGTEPLPQTTEKMAWIFDLGHGVHHQRQKLLEKYPGFTAEGRVDIPELGISGNTDGVFSKEGWILEIKSMSSDQFSRLMRPLKYNINQVHCYMVGLRIPRAQLVYINRDNGACRVFKIYFDPAIWAENEETIAFIENHITRDTVPDREPDFMQCRECKFAYICDPEGKNGDDVRFRQGATADRARPARLGFQQLTEPTREGTSVTSTGGDNVVTGAQRPVRRLSSLLRVSNKPAGSTNT